MPQWEHVFNGQVVVGEGGPVAAGVACVELRADAFAFQKEDVLQGWNQLVFFELIRLIVIASGGGENFDDHLRFGGLERRTAHLIPADYSDIRIESRICGYTFNDLIGTQDRATPGAQAISKRSQAVSRYEIVSEPSPTVA